MRTILAAALLAAAGTATADETGKPAKETKVAGPLGLTLTVRLQGPYAAPEPLQVVCYFRKAAGETLEGAPVELDKKLGGVIADLRGRGDFAGDFLETLLVETNGKIPAARLLLIGLGDEKNLTLRRMRAVGRTSFREAAKLGIERAAFAPMVKDQGSTRLPAGDAAKAIVTGVLAAQATRERMRKAGLAKPFRLKEWVQEAGPKYYDQTVAQVKKAAGG